MALEWPELVRIECYKVQRVASRPYKGSTSGFSQIYYISFIIHIESMHIYRTGVYGKWLVKGGARDRRAPKVYFGQHIDRQFMG